MKKHGFMPESDEHFFEDAFDFLSKYDWIYRTSNTEYLANGVLDRMPGEWIDFFGQLPNAELNMMPDGLEHRPDVPPSLQHFYQHLKRLQNQMIFEPYVPLTSTPSPPTHPAKSAAQSKGISQKKRHEIQRLSAEIRSLCDGIDKPIIVDLGCGLGYLSQLLHLQFGYRVLGIEADAGRVQSARQRQAQYFPASLNRVCYTELFVQNIAEAAQHIRHECQRLFDADGRSAQPPTIAIVGLHACAALSVTAAQLFVHMPEARVLSIMPCCYHKMCEADSSPDSGGGRHHRPRHDCIPLSGSMRRSVSAERWLRTVVNVPFLRLASQQGASRWRRQTAEQHAEHGAAMWERALLQAVLAEDEYVVGVAKHHLNGPPMSMRWPLLDKFSLRSRRDVSPDAATLEWSEGHSLKADSLRKQYPTGANCSELLTGLQTTIQSLCEYVVLHDRVCFLKEQLSLAGTNASVALRKIVCDELSPRCFLLVARKL